MKPEARRPVMLGLVGLIVAAVLATIGFTRQTADDRRELPRQVEFRIDGALIEGWTLTRPSCPDFGAAEEGAVINCSALATDSGGRERAANVTARIAHCNNGVAARLLGQDETRDCSYDFTYTIHQGGTPADDS